jgi:soluble cytochrome b562
MANDEFNDYVQAVRDELDSSQAAVTDSQEDLAAATKELEANPDSAEAKEYASDMAMIVEGCRQDHEAARAAAEVVETEVDRLAVIAQDESEAAIARVRNEEAAATLPSPETSDDEDN